MSCYLCLGECKKFKELLWRRCPPDQGLTWLTGVNHEMTYYHFENVQKTCKKGLYSNFNIEMHGVTSMHITFHKINETNVRNVHTELNIMMP